ncbi:MAG: hypothetical protein KDD47_02410 [Acidobacteria bacterium]|nr:hypothetical protein [Acidobacteriota bacterium]
MKEISRSRGWVPLIPVCLAAVLTAGTAPCFAGPHGGPEGSSAAALPPPARCSYGSPWYPYWPGQNDLPQARLRVLVNGDEIVNKGFCINQLWVWIGALREKIKNAVQNEIVNIDQCTPIGRYSVTSASVTETPLDTLFFSMEFREGSDLELLALTHGFTGRVHFNGVVEFDRPPTKPGSDPCHATCTCFDTRVGTAQGYVDLALPTLMSDGVYKPFQGVIDDWKVELPGASFNRSIAVNIENSTWVGQLLAAIDIFGGAESQVASAVASTVGGSIIREKAFAKIQDELEERLDPNDALASFLGPSSDIASALQLAANALGISIPSPPCGTRFSVYVKNPPSNRSSGGEVTIALFAPT